jgi:hypothetical protein
MAESGAGTSCGCGCSHTPEAKSEAASRSEPPPGPRPPAPGPASEASATPVDFVCEADVREAIRTHRKIHITPKTIVTPSARDLAGPSDILVLT